MMNTDAKPREKNNKRFLGILPRCTLLAVVLIPPTACFTTYGMAVHFGHVHADFPTISVAGNDPPESCIFGALLNLYAICSIMTAYFRYEQIYICYSEDEKDYPNRLNRAAFITGVLSSVGVFLVANFQIENIQVMHLVGSFSLLLFGMIFCWLQTKLSFRMTSLPGQSVGVCWVRMGFSVIQSLFFIVFCITWPMYEDEFWYRIAAIAEWLLCFSMSTFAVTFFPDFRHLIWKTSVIKHCPDQQVTIDTSYVWTTRL